MPCTQATRASKHAHKHDCGHRALYATSVSLSCQPPSSIQICPVPGPGCPFRHIVDHDVSFMRTFSASRVMPAIHPQRCNPPPPLPAAGRTANMRGRVAFSRFDWKGFKIRQERLAPVIPWAVSSPLNSPRSLSRVLRCGESARLCVFVQTPRAHERTCV